MVASPSSFRPRGCWRPRSYCHRESLQVSTHLATHSPSWNRPRVKRLNAFGCKKQQHIIACSQGKIVFLLHNTFLDFSSSLTVSWYPQILQLALLVTDSSGLAMSRAADLSVKESGLQASPSMLSLELYRMLHGRRSWFWECQLLPTCCHQWWSINRRRCPLPTWDVFFAFRWTL